MSVRLLVCLSIINSSECLSLSLSLPNNHYNIAQNDYLCPSLPNNHLAIAQNDYLCPSLPNNHHAYQLSDLLSRLLSLSACFSLNHFVKENQ